MPLSHRITGYSTALFSTWYFVEDFGVLFDCGDGVCSGLLQKARKIKHVFISHADRDHLTGLLQFIQLNGRSGLTIHYPKDCGSLPALAEFSQRFDPHVTGTRWSPLSPGDEITIRDNLIIRAIENRHVPTDGKQTKSLTYIAESISRKLKPEFQGLSGAEIAAAKRRPDVTSITDESRTIELIYSGDTPIETDGRYNNAKILIHEATFLTRAEIDPDNPKRSKHSSLDAVVEMVATSNIETLILGHFSSRYSNDEINTAIVQESQRNGIKIPIHTVYPGSVSSFE